MIISDKFLDLVFEVIKNPKDFKYIFECLFYANNSLQIPNFQENTRKKKLIKLFLKIECENIIKYKLKAKQNKINIEKRWENKQKATKTTNLHNQFTNMQKNLNTMQPISNQQQNNLTNESQSSNYQIVSIDNAYYTLLDDEDFLHNAKIMYKIDIDSIKQYLLQFNIYCHTQGNKQKSMLEFRKYFINWLTKKLKTKKETEQKNFDMFQYMLSNE